MDNIVGTILIGLAGAAIGWLFGRMDSWLRMREEHRRARRRVLSFLLDLHHALNILSKQTEVLLALIAEKLKAKLGPHLPTSELDAAIAAISPTLMRGLIKQLTGPTISSLQADYDSALHDLASIDPVMAYRLRGQTGVVQFLEVAKHWMDERTGGSTQVGNEQYETLLEPVVMERTAIALREHIRSLAFKCDRSVRDETEAVLEEHAGGFDSTMDEIMDNLASTIIQSYRPTA